MAGWIGVDLDGTLAEYDGWRGAGHIGFPIPLMLERVKRWLAKGTEVRIVTARVWSDGSAERDAEVLECHTSIHNWCVLNIGSALPITCCKDYGMIELWDDRCVQVIPNTGQRADGRND